MNSAANRLWKTLTSPPLSVVVFTTLVFVVSMLYSPPDVLPFSICPFKNITGHDCPGCGLTRSFCSLGKGHVGKGFELHPLGPVLFGIFVYWWLCSVLKLTKYEALGRRLEYPLTRKPFLFGLVALFLGVWLARLILGFTR